MKFDSKSAYKMKVTPKQSEQIQEICFKHDIGWGEHGEVREVRLTDRPHLNILMGKYLHANNSKRFFRADTSVELDPQEFINKYKI